MAGLGRILSAIHSLTHRQGRRTAEECVPDRPRTFGYKTAWFSLRTTDTYGVADAFGLKKIVPANWERGSQEPSTAFSEGSGIRVFIAPPVDGWTLVHGGAAFAADTPETAETLERRLTDLSRRFGEAQYFGTYRTIDYVAWYRAIDGNIVRGFSHADGDYVVNTGPTTPEELELGLADITGFSPEDLNFGESDTDLSEDEDGETWFPDEEDPARLAGKWSVNPNMLHKRDDLSEGCGLLGSLAER